jgi:hypothetical protein
MNSSLSSCTTCHAGSYSTAGAFQCEYCLKGTYASSDESSSCSTCVAGSYSEVLGASACLQCKAGTYSTLAAAQSSGSCKNCPSGTFSTVDGLSVLSGCIRCAPKTTSPPGSSFCSVCPVNSFPEPLTDTCIMCPRNTVTKNVTMLTDCSCSPGYYTAYNTKITGGDEDYFTDATGQIYKQHKFVGGVGEISVIIPVTLSLSCNGELLHEPFMWFPGRYPVDVTSTDCPPPFAISYPVDVVYDNSETSSYFQCSACPSGMYSDAEAMLECIGCKAGTYQDTAGQSSCKDCKPGSISGDSALVCDICPTGSTQNGNKCKPCAAGFYAGNSVECLKCNPNTWSEEGATVCKACPPWSESMGGTSLQGCICWEGLYMDTSYGLPSCMQCMAGRYSPRGSNDCIFCPNGTFSATIAQSSCLPCPDRSIATLGATACIGCAVGESPSSDGMSCQSCPPGMVCAQGQPIVACPPGTYSSVTGFTSVDQCLSCPPNRICTDPKSIEPCPPNTHSVPGSTSMLQCECDYGFDCTYTKTVKGKVVLPYSIDEFDQIKEDFLKAVADAAGESLCLVLFFSLSFTHYPPLLHTHAY